jgi:hypothetical protein
VLKLVSICFLYLIVLVDYFSNCKLFSEVQFNFVIKEIIYLGLGNNSEGKPISKDFCRSINQQGKFHDKEAGSSGFVPE